MSKQFVKGNVYVFTKKNYMKQQCKTHSKSFAKLYLKKWVNSVNGNEVVVEDKWNGKTGMMIVSPEWCKCIKNNNPKVESEEI